MRKQLRTSGECKDREIGELNARISKLEADLRQALRKIKKYRDLRSSCTCHAGSEVCSTILDAQDTMEIQVENEIRLATGLANWHLFSIKCSDERITPMFDLYNNWIIKNVSKAGDKLINRDRIVSDFMNNMQNMGKMIHFAKAESEIAKSK